MEQTYALAAGWLALAVFSTILASHLRVSMALVEICVGMVAAFVADHLLYPNALGANTDWLRFVASIGAVLLAFLAGAELDPAAMKVKFKEVIVVGLVGFVAPFLGCAAVARFVLGWNGPASWLAGIALSTTSMAVVYAVMLESGFNRTEFGKGIPGACFVDDLGTVIALGLMFAPFTYRTVIFLGVSIVLISLLPAITSGLIARYGNRTAAIRTKLFSAKTASKIFGLHPVIGMFREDGKERWYYTLMMSTGLTFGTISALYGMTHEIVTQQQYSFLVAAVIASAVIPTLIANAAFLPSHLLPGRDEEVPQLEAAFAGTGDSSNGLGDE